MSDKPSSLQPTISHDAVIELLDAYSTGELAASEVRLVKQHLENCSSCQQFLQDVQRFHALLSAQEHQRIYELPSISEAVMQEIQLADNVLVPMNNFEKLPQPPQKRKFLSRTLLIMLAVLIAVILVGSFIAVGSALPVFLPNNFGSQVTSKVPAIGEPNPPVGVPMPPAPPAPPVPPVGVLTQKDILWSLHMFDQNSGWATNKSGILQTSDGGVHWHNVSPPGPYDFGLSTVNFFSPQIAWMVGINNTTSKYSSFVTSDGGKNWLRSDALGDQITLGPSVGIHDLSVVSAQECWLFATIPSAQNGLESVAFHSTNGGKDWQVLPLKGIAATSSVTGTFLNGTTGWFVIGKFAIDSSAVPADVSGSGAPILYETKDGGVSWQQQAIALPAGLASGNFELPTFLNAKEGLLPLVFTKTGDTTSWVLAYSTHNGGATWNASSMFPLITTMQSGSITLDFWFNTAQVWGVTEIRRASSDGTVFQDHPIVHLTQDGGQNWSQVESTALLQVIDQSTFVSIWQGWALGVPGSARENVAPLPQGTPGKSGGLLLKTLDGGQTWQYIPLLVN